MEQRVEGDSDDRRGRRGQDTMGETSWQQYIPRVAHTLEYGVQNTDN